MQNFFKQNISMSFFLLFHNKMNGWKKCAENGLQIGKMA